jgi:hypothetical protein
VVDALGPAVERLEPALRDLVPAVRYAAPYGREIVGLVGGAGAGVHRLLPNGRTGYLDRSVQQMKPEIGWHTDNVLWGRFLIDSDPTYTLDQPDANTKKNPYPAPHDPFSAYRPGSYPHLLPYPAER